MSNPSKFNSLQRKRLYEEVSAAIKKAIFEGDYDVGDKLPSEIELSKLFQVSRPVIREAIRYLEIMGIVNVRQGATGGAFVSGITSRVLQENIKDLLVLGNLSVAQLTEMRTHIDPEIARLAALRAETEDLKELERSVALSKSLDPEIGFMDHVENNARFHRLLGRASHNLFYTIIEDVIMDFTVEFIQTVQVKHEVLHDQNQHEDIFQAVLEQDPDRAEAITQEHIKKIGSQMRALEEVFLELSGQESALDP